MFIPLHSRRKNGGSLGVLRKRWDWVVSEVIVGYRGYWKVLENNFGSLEKAITFAAPSEKRGKRKAVLK